MHIVSGNSLGDLIKQIFSSTVKCIGKCIAVSGPNYS